MAAQIKISRAYWESCRDIEKKYIQERVGVETLHTIKMKIKDARQQIPGFIAIHGKGFVTDKDGHIYLWSGDVTRTYSKFQPT